jgi:hypothetical protein
MVAHGVAVYAAGFFVARECEKIQSALPKIIKKISYIFV